MHQVLSQVRAVSPVGLDQALVDAPGGLDRSVALAGEQNRETPGLGVDEQAGSNVQGAPGVTGMADPYERLKELTRGKKVTPEGMREFISGLSMPDDVEARLLALTPATYTGLAAELVSHLDD